MFINSNSTSFKRLIKYGLYLIVMMPIIIVGILQCDSPGIEECSSTFFLNEFLFEFRFLEFLNIVGT